MDIIENTVFRPADKVETLAVKQPPLTPHYPGPLVADRSLMLIGITLNKAVINSFIYTAMNGDMRRLSAFKREVTSDPFVSGEINKIRSKLISSPMLFSPYPSTLQKASVANTAEAKRSFLITDYIKRQLLDSADLLRQAISELFYGLLDGVAILEIVAEVQDGEVKLKELITVPQERIAYLPGTTTLGVQLGADVAKLTPIDQLDSHFIVFIADQNDPNPARRGLLRKCISPWFTSRYVNEWWSRGTELNGQPTRIAYYDPSDKEMKLELEQMMERAGSSTYLVLPKGTEITFENSITAANTTLYSELLDACHEQISIALLGATQTTQIKPNSGSRASSTIHYEVATNTVNGYGLAICAVLRDQLLAKLVEWQFSPEDAQRFTPTMTLKVLGYEDIEKLAGTLPVMAAAGLPISLSYIYDSSGIPTPDPDEKTLQAIPGGSPDKPSTAPMKDPPDPSQLLEIEDDETEEQFEDRKKFVSRRHNLLKQSRELFSRKPTKDIVSIEKQVGDILIGPYAQHIEKLKSEGADLKRIGASLNLFSLSKGESKKKAQEIVQAFMVSEFMKGYNNASS